MTNKVVSLVSNIAKEETYEECIKRHLESLTEEQKNAIPHSLFVGGLLNDNSSVYQILAGDEGLEIIGSLELLKQYVLYDMTIGE